MFLLDLTPIPPSGDRFTNSLAQINARQGLFADALRTSASTPNTRPAPAQNPLQPLVLIVNGIASRISEVIPRALFELALQVKDQLPNSQIACSTIRTALRQQSSPNLARFIFSVFKTPEFETKLRCELERFVKAQEEERRNA